MKKGILFLIASLVFIFSLVVFAQSGSPAPSPTPVVQSSSSGVSGVFSWFVSNWGTIATVLLGISESLALLFPSSSGFGGIVAGIISFLKGIGVKPPQSPASS